jgi:hypothetical protein
LSRLVVLVLAVAGLAGPTPPPADVGRSTSTTSTSTSTSTTSTTLARVTGSSDVARQLREAWPEEPERAVAVGQCESKLKPGAKNGQHWGILQIATKVHAKRIAAMGYTPADMLDVGPNLAVGRALYDESRWGPWKSSRHCWAPA